MVIVRVKADKTLRMLAGLGEGIKEPRRALKESIEYLKRDTEVRVFGTEGGSIGKRWAGLSPAYAVWKARHYPGRGKLVASGKMRKSFYTRVRRTKAILGNNDKKFAFHQLGTRKMPRRVMLYADDRRARQVEKIFVKNLGSK